MNASLVDTWTCHVCGDERPDSQIAVHKTRWLLPGHGQVAVQTNVRYCRDRATCHDRAGKVGRGWLGNDAVVDPSWRPE